MGIASGSYCSCGTSSIVRDSGSECVNSGVGSSSSSIRDGSKKVPLLGCDDTVAVTGVAVAEGDASAVFFLPFVLFFVLL